VSNNLRFVEKLANAPWLCAPEHVEFLHGIFLRYLDRAATGESFDRQAVEQAVGRPLDNTREVTVRDGVARIPVEGTIVRRASIFTEISGGVSTEALTKDFITAHNDATVHSILFVFDSPGGEAYGINELAGAIREKRDLGEKRIEAYCDGMCASAAYWLASATSKITTDATGALGGIGVVSRVGNPDALSKRDTLEFWNSRSPKKRLDYRSYEGQTAIQEYVDSLGDEFIRSVADNRGVSFEKVERDFGQGFVLVGRKAVKAGLADQLGSEEGVVASLLARERSPTLEVAAMGSAANHDKEVQVTEQVAGQTPKESRESEEEARGIVASMRRLLGMSEPRLDSPAEEPSARLSIDEERLRAFSDSGKLEDSNGQAGEQREEMGSAVEENMAGRPVEPAQTDPERGGEPRAVGNAPTREELQSLRAELEAERGERLRASAILREQAVSRMLEAKADLRGPDGERYAMPPAKREAASALISALEGTELDPVTLSASGQADLRDNEVGKAVSELLAPWKPQELGERGTAAAETDDDALYEQRVSDYMKENGVSRREAVRALSEAGEVSF
jgi:ClpP class serine protease